MKDIKSNLLRLIATSMLIELLVACGASQPKASPQITPAQQLDNHNAVANVEMSVPVQATEIVSQSQNLKSLESSAEWLRYEFSSGQSFSYPNYLVIDTSLLSDHGYVSLHESTGERMQMYTVRVELQTLQHPSRLLACAQDPRPLHGQNEDAAGIRWLVELRSNRVIGLQYVWGAPINNYPGSANLLHGELNAVLVHYPMLYSTEPDSCITISWLITEPDDLDYANRFGIEKMVQDRFRDFHQIVNSVRF